MRTSRRLHIPLAVTLLAAVCLSCSRSGEDPGRALSADELARLNRAFAQYHSRMNQEQFDQIWDERRPVLDFTKESFVNNLARIREKYGKVSRATPIRALAYPSAEVPGNMAVQGWYEVEGEGGKYMDNLMWHFIGDETKLVDQRLYEYDEVGQLYMETTLRTGLEPNNRQSYKAPIRVTHNVE